MRLKILFVCALGALSMSCISFPTRSLDIDFTNQAIPVMLSKPEGDISARKITLSSGYQSVSVSMASSINGNISTITATIGQDQNLPVALQLGSRLINNTLPIFLSGYKVRVERFESIRYKKLNYLSTYEFSLPVEGVLK